MSPGAESSLAAKPLPSGPRGARSGRAAALSDSETTVTSRTPAKTSGTSTPVDERTPLVVSSAPRRSIWAPLKRIYFTTLLVTFTFSITQTPLIYSFRTMSCDAYYQTRKWTGKGDRCNIPEVESMTSTNVALMSSLTTGSTLVNLFVSAWVIAHKGVKSAMFRQTAWAALRNLTQIYAQTVGGRTGIRIIQTTQLFNIMGSAGGMQLCANSYVSVLSSEQSRTANFGILAGTIMFGSAAGFVIGGAAQKIIGRLSPWYLAFGLLCFCTAFAMFFLPYHAPEMRADSDEPAKKKGNFLSPLKVFVPRRTVNVDGRITRNWNLFWLGLGTFFSVLATSYVPMALQLVAIYKHGFTAESSGYMLSLNLLVRGFFLTAIFPAIIARGRRWLAPCRESCPGTPRDSDFVERPDDPNLAEVPDAAGEPVTEHAPQLAHTASQTRFDLLFLRNSILLDGILTGTVTLASKQWHIYLAAAVLPFASGTGPASKGVILEFVAPEEKADAISAIALVEKLGQVTSIGMFGYATAKLSEVGRSELIFSADAAIAFLAFVMLLPVRVMRLAPRVGA